MHQRKNVPLTFSHTGTWHDSKHAWCTKSTVLHTNNTNTLEAVILLTWFSWVQTLNNPTNSVDLQNLKAVVYCSCRFPVQIHRLHQAIPTKNFCLLPASTNRTKPERQISKSGVWKVGFASSSAISNVYIMIKEKPTSSPKIRVRQEMVQVAGMTISTRPKKHLANCKAQNMLLRAPNCIKCYKTFVRN